MDPQELEQIQEFKQQLNKVSASFCPVKWKHATVNLGVGAVKSCCHQSFRKIDLNQIKKGRQFHETAEDLKERRIMLVGGRPKNCSYCWWIEDKGHISDRHAWANKVWMKPFVPELAASGVPEAASPSWLELNFSSVCNFKCSYCSPIFSNQWLKEVEKFGPYDTEPKHNDAKFLDNVQFNQNYDNTEVTEAFWQWFDKIYPGVRLLKITGGEPLLSNNTFRLLEMLEKRPNKHLVVSINTNMCPPDAQWDRFIEICAKFIRDKVIANLYLHPSLDAWGERSEYIRYGLNFQTFESHLYDFLNNVPANIVFICTSNNLSLGGLLEYWKKLYEIKQEYGHDRWISITTEVLQDPEWQNVNILPKEFQIYVEQTMSYVESRITDNPEGFYRFELLQLQRLLDLMKQPNKHLYRARKNFVRFFRQHDERRNTSFHDSFPELNKFWQECTDLEAN